MVALPACSFPVCRRVRPNAADACAAPIPPPLAAQVPPGLTSCDVCVEVRPRYVCVSHRPTGRVLLAGGLERAVRPGETTWGLEPLPPCTGAQPDGLDEDLEDGDGWCTAEGSSSHGSAAPGGGAGEAKKGLGQEQRQESWRRVGVLITLVKAEAADGVSSAGWWSRLLEGWPAVAWEHVTERDYSTLPAEALWEHRRRQAQLEEATWGGGGGAGEVETEAGEQGVKAKGAQGMERKGERSVLEGSLEDVS